MTTNSKKGMSKSAVYMRRLWKELRAAFGGVCSNPVCEHKEGLEFAHIKPTSVSGEGRGSWRRYKDIKANPDCYTLMCRSCHCYYDDTGEYPDAEYLNQYKNAKLEGLETELTEENEVPF